MTNTAAILANATPSELLAELRRQPTWPVPELLQEILDRGPTMVEPVRQMVRDESRAPTESMLAEMLSGLLCDLKATEAIEDLVRMLIVTRDEEGSEGVVQNILDLGGAPAPLLLELLPDDTIYDVAYMGLMNLCVHRAQTSPETRDSLVEAIFDKLNEIVWPKDRKRRGLHEQAPWLATALAQLKVLKSIPLINAGFDRGVISPQVVDRMDIEGQFSGAFDEDEDGDQDENEDQDASHDDTKISFLDEYRTLFEEQVQHRAEDLVLQSRDGDHATGPEPIRVAHVGRNDPCPCGSGKKYKKCCLGKTA